MTDLDSTEIISADESLTENSSTTVPNASLKVLSGIDPRTFDINKETTIGRGNPSDLIISAPSLSKQHAKITISNGQYFITDLGSSNKTFHNKVQLQSNVCYALHNGDELKFGDVVCCFQEQEQADLKNEMEPEVNNNPPTQTITNSYDDHEPAQPIKVWSANKEDSHGQDNTALKQNGTSSSPSKSSLFTPYSSSANMNTDDDNQIIGSTSSSTSVIEPKQLNHNDQLEIISSPQAKKNFTNESKSPAKMEDTPPPSDAPTGNENTSETDMETLAAATKPIVNLEEKMENSPAEAVEQVVEPDNITDDTPVEKEKLSEKQMDTDETSESPAMVVDDKAQENVDDMEAETAAPVTSADAMTVDEIDRVQQAEIPSTTMEQELTSDGDQTLPTSSTEPVKPMDDSAPVVETESASIIKKEDQDEEEEEAAGGEENEEETEGAAAVSGRGFPRKTARRARGRRGAGGRARVISTRLHSGRRNPIPPPAIKTEENNTTLEETVNTEPEESPRKTILTPEVKERRSRKKDEPITPSAEAASADTSSNVRVSARIKERASSGRNRQFPYANDYVDLDDIEKRSKANANAAPAASAATTAPSPLTTTKSPGRPSKRGRASASPQKRVSLRQQPIDAIDTGKQETETDVYEQMDTTAETKEPTPKAGGRKRKSTTPVAAVASKRSRAATPQTLPTANTRRKQTTSVEVSPTVARSNRRTTGGQKQAPPPPPPPPAVSPPPPPPPTTTTTTSVTPKRGRKSAKQVTPRQASPDKSSKTADRPVRIALSSHLNFDQNHFEALRKLDFEIMDESCQVDALVVDRIRRTKKFFMCLARGALILSPSWIEAMVKENQYIPYEKYFLEDTNAETRYGFQLRESVRRAKQGPIFQNHKFFCTKDTSPPYDDLKDIIEAAGGKLLEKINMNKPSKDIICIVAQVHKNEYEDLFRKGISIVSEEFILSGISKQKLDFDSFSLFQNATTSKTNLGK
ncbi:unnamed protein product [Adineta ricciae]|uniref:Mediator of DNA damage checkpoint protein 1 n=1 Tax=Adineta ricciae TaxID=249248 RepID=A0A814W687_ADIRI|nr:unnamed protein product [Adineta ricciae]